MAITFVYRSPYDNPSGKFVKRFEHESILAWFQDHWKEYDFEDESLPCITTSVLGKHVYGFDLLFMDIAREKLTKPTSNRALSKVLRFSEGWHEFHKHLLEVTTNDDEWALEFYFIDDALVEAHPDKLTYFVRDTALPIEVDQKVLKSARKDDARTYLFVQAPDHGDDQNVWDRIVVPGVRLDDFSTVARAFGELDDVEAQTVQEFLLDSAKAGTTWKQALSKLSKVDMYSDRLGNQSQIDCSKHFCQLHHHAGTWGNSAFPKNLFHQLLVFDDIWAASHPNLATSIQFFGSNQPLLPLAKAKKRAAKR